MPRLFLALVMIAATALPGCSWYDALFNVAGSHYSGGGPSELDQRADYNANVREHGGEVSGF